MEGTQIAASALQHTRSHCSGNGSVVAEGSSLDRTARTIWKKFRRVTVRA